LSVVSSDAPTLLPLCQLFENLLLVISPTLAMKFNSVDFKPLQVLLHLSHHLIHQLVSQIALKWMMSCFVDLLDVDQVLILWDRIIGEKLSPSKLFSPSYSFIRDKRMDGVLSLSTTRQ
jgi:hypothetical protein